MIRRRPTARLVALRLGAGVLALCSFAASAQGPTRPLPPERVVDGLYAVVAGAVSAGEAGIESRVPIFTLMVPLAGADAPPVRLGAHMTIGNQPRRSSAIIFSTVVPF
jgi:hypothetical protein